MPVVTAIGGFTSPRAGFLAAAGSTVELFGDPAVAAGWNRSSALSGWSVSGVAGHLLRQILNVDDVLDAGTPTDPPLSLIEHYSRTAVSDADLDDLPNVETRRDGVELADGGSRAVAERAAAELGRVRERLAAEPPGRAVLLTWRGWSLTLDDFLITRTIELAVHSDDLAVSVGIPTPQLPAPVLDVVLQTLVRVAARRYGGTAVLRALSRAERAPNHISAFS
jgi:Mycothiol maleylpyruvate isomerase N-terminal domain